MPYHIHTMTLGDTIILPCAELRFSTPHKTIYLDRQPRRQPKKNKNTKKNPVAWWFNSRSDWRVLQRRYQPTPTGRIYLVMDIRTKGLRRGGLMLAAAPRIPAMGDRCRYGRIRIGPAKATAMPRGKNCSNGRYPQPQHIISSVLHTCTRLVQ